MVCGDGVGAWCGDGVGAWCVMMGWGHGVW